MESVVKIIEFFRIISMTSRNGGYTFDQSKCGGFYNYSSYKEGGNNNMFCALKKTIGVILIGIGLGILLVLLLPLTGWLFIIGVALACVGLMWLAC